MWGARLIFVPRRQLLASHSVRKRRLDRAYASRAHGRCRIHEDVECVRTAKSLWTGYHGDFRKFAAEFLPAGSDDAKLENFFEQWVYGTGIPTLKMTTSVKGKAPRLRVTGAIQQSECK